MRLRDHYLVCGFGRVGRNAAFELQKAGAPFVVIDKNDDRVERAMLAGMMAVSADALSDDTLREAGIVHARGLIAALATDAENVFVCLSARSMNATMTIVTRASEENAEAKLRRAGADIVFSPYAMAGHRLAQALVRPHVAELMDFAPQVEGLDVSMEQLEVSPKSQLAGRELREFTNDGDARNAVSGCPGIAQRVGRKTGFLILRYPATVGAGRFSDRDGRTPNVAEDGIDAGPGEEPI